MASRFPLVAALFIASAPVLAAAPRDPAPLAREAIEAVHRAQGPQADGPNLARSLQRQLVELRESFADPEEAPAALRSDSAQRSAAAAGQVQTATFKENFRSQLDAAEKAWREAGDGARADEVRAFKARLEVRFRRLDDALGQLASAGNPAEVRMRRAELRKRLDGWLAAGEAPVSLPGPNWTRSEPLTPQAQPAAKEPPRFVADTLWLMHQRYADAGGMVRVALKPTPSGAAACGYDSADLADSAEAPKTHPDITALAAELDHNPVRMFEWVSQNIAFEPYFGALKGGLGALWSRSGGATDQASLLVALLRSANIPARYVRGQVMVLDATELGAEGRAPRWIGAKSYASAAAILAANGNPNAATQAIGSVVRGVSMAHVWVEACLPYAAYRGAAVDDAGHRWVPLDASYKDRRYTAGVPVDAGFDFDYTGFLARRLDAQGRYRLPQEQLEDQVEAHARTKGPHYGNNTLDDVPYRAEIKRQSFDILPIVPPYEITQYTAWDGASGPAEVAQLPDRHRYRAQITVRNKSGTSDAYAGNMLWQRSFNLPDIALKRLTLGFKGATPADQTAYDTWFNAVNPGATPSCAATVNVTPVVRLEGAEQTASSGSGSTTLCSMDNVLELRVTLGEVTANGGVLGSAGYAAIAGANLHALHIYAWQTSDTLLGKRADLLLDNVRAQSNPNNDRDGIEGEFLHLAATKYSRYTADANKRAGELFGESGTTGISIGLTAGQVKVSTLFDLPYGITRKGFYIDWPGGKYSGTRLDAPSNTDRRAFKVAGFASSAYEAYIWQENALVDAVSTTRGLQYAKEQNYEVLTLNAGNWSTESCKLNNSCSSGGWNTNPASANYSAGSIGSIKTQYIDQGFTLTIPRRLLEYPDSTGATGWKGYTFYGEKFTATVAEAAFPIGAHSGGFTLGGTVGNSFNSGLGTGFQKEASAPTFAQASGQNSGSSANGFLSGLTTYAGDPVNMVTGNLIHSERDVVIKGRGGLPIVFERWYNSLNAKDGPLGYGWTHSFNHFLRFYGVEGGSAKLSWTDGTGGERFFATTGHSGGNINVGASFSGAAGIYATLERLADGKYRITERSGMKYVFESVTAGASDTGLTARLLSIADRNGNTLTLAYSAACGNKLCTVTDALSRALTFSYSGSRIDTLADWTGRQWKYEYDSAGDLVRFKNPLAVAGSQNPLSYSYYGTADGARLAHAMREYTLPRGNGMRFEYHANGRVFRHTPFGTDGVALDEQATRFAWNEFRRESREIHASGTQRTFFFDAYGNPIKIIDEAGGETEYTYDTAAGRTHLRLSKTDSAGLTTAYGYDAQGNLTDVTLPSGRTLHYRDHTAFGQPKRVKDANGHWTLLRYASNGLLTDEIRAKAGVTPAADTAPTAANIVAWTQYRGDAAGNLTGVRRLRDWSSATLGNWSSGVGPALEYGYDTSLLNVTTLTRRGDTDGTPASLETDSFSDFQYDALGRQTRGPDVAWYAASTGYDALDRPRSSSDALGNTWTTSYDANGNPVAAQLAVGNAVLDSYYAAWDEADRQERRVDYAGNATQWRYDARGRVLSMTDPDGTTLGFDRDGVGRITGAYNQEGHRVSSDVDTEGRVRSVTDPNGLTTTYSYHHASEDGRLQRTTLPAVSGQGAGRAIEIAAYDGLGRATRTLLVAADGSTRDTYSFHDELGRLTRQVGPQVAPPGNTSRPVRCYVYTPLGNVKEIWAGSTADTSSRDCTLDGSSIKRQVSYVWDDFGRKLSETDALGRTWRWNWNLHAELVSSQTPVQAAAGQSTSYQWQRGGLLKRRTVPGSGGAAQTAAYSYDTQGRLTRAETLDGAGALRVAYDYTYDAAHRVRTVTDSRGAKTLTYTWTPGGRLARLEDSDGHVISFAYDAVGRLANLTTPNNEQFSFTWDAGGRLTERRSASGFVTTLDWFEDGSLKLRESRAGASVLTRHDYALDAQGRRSAHTERIGTSTTDWTYGYDSLDRLTSASDGSAETYSYDIWGNRRSTTRAGTTTAYLYDAAHQLSEIRQGSDSGALIGAAVHDAAGRLTKLCEGSGVSKSASDCSGSTSLQLAYNALDQLLSATRSGTGAVAESYLHDDAGRRIQKTTAAGSVAYRYNGEDLHAEWNAATPGGMPAALYVHGPGRDDPLLRLTGQTAGPSAVARSYLSDGLGSLVAYAGELSAGGPVSASSASGSGNYNEGAYPPARVIDGNTTDPNSIWAGNTGSGAALTLELGSVKTVSRLTLHWAAGYGNGYIVKDATVQIRNPDNSWRTVGTLAGNTTEQSPTVALAGATSSAIRVQFSAARSGGIVLVSEITLEADGGAASLVTQRFDAWGNTLAGSGSLPQYGYTGREPDATGLIHYRARAYHPGIGRFTSRDPMGMVDAVSPYAYVGNSPTHYADPQGSRSYAPDIARSN